MYQIKHFSSRTVGNTLEQSVNRWLESNDMKVIDMQYRATTYGNMESTNYSVVILYENR